MYMAAQVDQLLERVDALSAMVEALSARVIALEGRDYPISTCADLSAEISAVVEAKMSQQIVVGRDTHQLALEGQLVNMRAIESQLVAVIESQSARVYDQVVADINETIVPQVNNMVEWVNHNMQDGNETVDRFRRAVESQHRLDPRIMLLTDGKRDDRIISPHVRTFFSNDD